MYKVVNIMFDRIYHFNEVKKNILFSPDELPQVCVVPLNTRTLPDSRRTTMFSPENTPNLTVASDCWTKWEVKQNNTVTNSVTHKIHYKEMQSNTISRLDGTFNSTVVAKLSWVNKHFELKRDKHFDNKWIIHVSKNQGFHSSKAVQQIANPFLSTSFILGVQI